MFYNLPRYILGLSYLLVVLYELTEFLELRDSPIVTMASHGSETTPIALL